MGSPLSSVDNEMEYEELSWNYKLVPWISWEEWNFVRDSLFLSSADCVSAALKRISTWRSRGNVPIVIEITASIIEIQQKDPFFREGLDDNASNSEEVLIMLYCMAIMRLVNGVVEKTRKKAEVSIAVEADRIGLPRMLIDIRHEASHRDLPSLQLVRLASVTALDWLKSYYWEPQKNVVPFQKQRIANARNKVKSKLQELAYYLKMMQASQSGSSPIKRKRMRLPEEIYCHKKTFDHTIEKLQGSNSQGPKGQIKRIIRVLVRLYFSFPSEVVASLMDFLAKSLESSDCNEAEPSNTSAKENISQNSEDFTDTTVIWKLIITRFSSKVPELIFVMLKELLEMIESCETMKFKNGTFHLPWSGRKAEDHQVEHLSSLVLWLIETYKRANHPAQTVCSAEVQESSNKENATKLTLAELLKKCLMVLPPGNDQLAESALLIAHMVRNSSMVEKVKKLCLLSFRNLGGTGESSTLTDIDHANLEKESSLLRAPEMLKSLKRCNQSKHKAVAVGLTDGDLEQKNIRWRVAKSWKPCPIGMLPCHYSVGSIPILERTFVVPPIEQATEIGKRGERNSCTAKLNDGCDVESLEDSNTMKKLRIMVDEGPGDDQDSPCEPFKGRLLIDGKWKKVGEEELFALESAVKVLISEIITGIRNENLKVWRKCWNRDRLGPLALSDSEVGIEDIFLNIWRQGYDVRYGFGEVGGFRG